MKANKLSPPSGWHSLGVGRNVGEEIITLHGILCIFFPVFWTQCCQYSIKIVLIYLDISLPINFPSFLLIYSSDTINISRIGILQISQVVLILKWLFALSHLKDQFPSPKFLAWHWFSLSSMTMCHCPLVAVPDKEPWPHSKCSSFLQDPIFSCGCFKSSCVFVSDVPMKCESM